MTTILLIDNYDSFTYNLRDYFLQLGTECTVVRNDEWSVEQFARAEFDGLALSPGPQRPADAGLLMWAIEHFHDRCPILGICLGHQGIGEFFGAKLLRAGLPMHGKTSVITHDNQGLFKGLPPNVQVMRYHSLILEDLEGTPLLATSHSEQGEVMSLRHESLPICGVQFHPESILTPQGLDMLRNWVDSLPSRSVKGLI
jgi:anthranilate synthase/aminodeoxychorismate synthase-like glutamine amidotransferase